jgi:methylglutaconyl-CoA hydratase
MMPGVLAIERQGSRLTLLLQRPERRNALDETTIAALTRAFREDALQDGVRVVVLAGEGKSFCAGADLAYMQRLAAADKETNLKDAAALGELFRAVYECPRPVIARVQGAAIGGGLGLVAAVDIAVATPDAKFGFTEARLGIVPGVISPFAMRRIGVAACRRLFLTAEIFDGAEARRLGLVDHLAEESRLDAVVDSQVEALRVGGPQAQAASKRLLDEIADLDLPAAMEVTPKHIADQRATAEAAEGFRAFFEKRSAEWVGEDDA